MSDEVMNIDVEADASAATRSSKAVADELTRVVSNVAQLESKLRAILSGKLPKEMEQLAGYLQLIQTSANFPVNGRVFNSQVRNLASGGPAAQLNRAAFQGAMTTLRNDPIVQRLKYEKELNKIYEARGKIYNRLREGQDVGLSETYRAKAYRDALKEFGDGPQTLEETKKFNARTLAEVRKFEQDRLTLQKEFDAKRVAEAQATFDKMATRSFARLYGRQDREAASAASLAQLEAYGARRGMDTSKLRSMYDQGLETYLATNVAKPPKPKVVQPTQEEKIAGSLRGIQDRFNYNGGAGMFGVQATILRNYATMGAVLGTMSFVAKSTTEFQASLKDIQAISTATDTEMQSLSKTIMDVGVNSKLSTKDIAEGAKVLAQAGYSVQQIQTMLKPINDLAVGSGSSLADAANITTSILSQFDLSVSRTADVTNLLVAGLNQSKLSMQQLSLGIQYAGNTAAQGGVQLNELVAALAAASDAGIKSGSTLGTGLRAMIIALDTPTAKLKKALQDVHLTEQDVDLKTHSLVEVLRTLHDAGFDSSKAFASMQTRAAAMFAALSGNVDKMDAYTNSLVGTQAATEASATQMESFTAKWQRLLNVVTQTSYIMGGPILGALGAFAGGLAAVLVAAQPLAPVVQVLAAALASLAIVKTAEFLIGLVKGLSAAQLQMVMLRIGTLNMIAAFEGLGAAAAVLAGELVVPAIIAGLTLLILHLGKAQGAQASLNAELDRYKAAANEAKAATTEYQSRVTEIDKYIEVLSNRHTTLSHNVDLAAKEADKASARFGAWGLQMDESGRHVDGLIQKLVELRSEMAAVAHEQALKEKGELKKQATTLDSAIDSQRGVLQQRARNLLNDRSLTGGLSSQGRAALQAFARGDLSLNDVNSNTAILRSIIARGDGRGVSTGALQRFLEAVAPVTSNIVKRTEVSGQQQANAQTLAGTNIAQSVYGQDANNSIVSMSNSWRDRQAVIDRMRPGRDKVKAQADFDAERRVELQGLQTHLQDLSGSLIQDPEVAAAYGGKADAVYKDMASLYPALSGLMAQGGNYSGITSPKVLRSRATRLSAEANAARAAGNMAEFKRKRDELKKVKVQLAGMTDNVDAEGLLQIEDDAGATTDAQTQAAMARGNRGARRTAQADIKSLERQIEVMMGSAGPGPSQILAAQPKLKELLDKWEAANRSSIRAQGGDVEQQLKDFNDKAKEYRDKVLGGNLQAAKDLMAKLAGDAAGRAGATAAADVRAGKVPLPEAMKDVKDSFSDYLDKTLDAAKQAIATAGFNTETSATLARQVTEKTREIVGQMTTSLTALLDAENVRIHEELRKQELADAAKSVRIQALSNFYGQRNLSDVQRYLGGLDQHQLDVNAAQRAVTGAKADYDRAVGMQSIYSEADRRLGTAETGKDLEAAAKNTQDMEAALITAENAFDAMSAKAPSFKSVTEAITASWKAYADQARLNMPLFEQLADGLTGVFDAGRQSFGKMVTDVLTGSQTMGQAIKNFTLSVLQAFMDMVAKMIANKLLMWAMKLILAMITKGGGGASPTGSADFVDGPEMFASIGGEVPRRFALGGAPNRDSLLAAVMPGEVIWRKSAVDMIGRENLLQMNAMGNRRISQMPTLQQEKREPDTVNVWVVQPQAKPQITKKDIVATVSEDIVNGGKTKQLIKAVQVGAA